MCACVCCQWIIAKQKFQGLDFLKPSRLQNMPHLAKWERVFNMKYKNVFHLINDQIDEVFHVVNFILDIHKSKVNKDFTYLQKKYIYEEALKN